jgi:hypothetical protein
MTVLKRSGDTQIEACYQYLEGWQQDSEGIQEQVDASLPVLREGYCASL